MPDLQLQSIRLAVMSGEFQRAQTLWDACVADLAGELRAGSLTEAQLAEVRELVGWVRTEVICTRAHLCERINALHAASEYEITTSPRQSRLVEAVF